MTALALLPALALAASPGQPARTEIQARLDPAIHRIEASAVLVVEGEGGSAPDFELSARLRVQEVLCDGDRVAFDVVPSEKDPGMSRIRLRPKGRAPQHCTIRYAGEIHDPPRVASFSRERIADQTTGTIEPAGVFLSPDSGWYPRASTDPARFRLEVVLPAGWDAIAEGSEKSRGPESSGVRLVFETVVPTEGLNLVAGPWKRREAEHKGVRVATFLYADDGDLAEPYSAGVKRYLDLYSAWLGPYPFDRFAVVENFFSTGYGMAGFTLLGQDVMRLPFIVNTSLGHEVAHNWFGNGVLVDETRGNWCEGLTTFVADYHYKRTESAAAAAEYRREVCRDYTNYVSEAGKDFPLSEFGERTTAATRAVGYGKTMMVFAMLERRLGKERFDEVLRRVFRDNLGKKASWDTWQVAFSRAAGEDLGWFFEQWVRRPGAPLLAVSDFSVREKPAAEGSAFEVVGTLRQKGGAWRVDVPLVIEGGGRVEARSIEIGQEATPVRLELPFRPSVLRIDPDQEVFRRLDPLEMPPVLSRVLGDPKAFLVVDDSAPSDVVAAYREMAATLTRSGMGEVVDASRVSAAGLAGRNVFLLGLPSSGQLRDLLAQIPSEVGLEKDGFAAAERRFGEPGAALAVVGRLADPGKAVALFWGLSAEAVRAAGGKLVHYGKYSYLAFVDGRNQVKGVAKVDAGPLRVELP